MNPDPLALTKREWEVAQLLRQGLPDKGIANRLGISRYTVNSHCRNIYVKLGLPTRQAVACWVCQQEGKEKQNNGTDDG